MSAAHLFEVPHTLSFHRSVSKKLFVLALSWFWIGTAQAQQVVEVPGLLDTRATVEKNGVLISMSSFESLSFHYPDGDGYRFGAAIGFDGITVPSHMASKQDPSDLTLYISNFRGVYKFTLDRLPDNYENYTIDESAITPVYCGNADCTQNINNIGAQLIFGPSDRYLYLIGGSVNKVVVIDTATDSVITSMPINDYRQAQKLDAAISADGTQLVISSTSNVPPQFTIRTFEIRPHGQLSILRTDAVYPEEGVLNIIAPQVVADPIERDAFYVSFTTDHGRMEVRKYWGDGRRERLARYTSLGGLCTGVRVEPNSERALLSAGGTTWATMSEDDSMAIRSIQPQTRGTSGCYVKNLSSGAMLVVPNGHRRWQLYTARQFPASPMDDQIVTVQLNDSPDVDVYEISRQGSSGVRNFIARVPSNAAAGTAVAALMTAERAEGAEPITYAEGMSRVNYGVELSPYMAARVPEGGNASERIQNDEIRRAFVDFMPSIVDQFRNKAPIYFSDDVVNGEVLAGYMVSETIDYYGRSHATITPIDPLTRDKYDCLTDDLYRGRSVRDIVGVHRAQFRASLPLAEADDACAGVGGSTGLFSDEGLRSLAINADADASSGGCSMQVSGTAGAVQLLLMVSILTGLLLRRRQSLVRISK